MSDESFVTGHLWRARASKAMKRLPAVLFALWSFAASAAVERSYGLPCEVASIAPSGDGRIVWIACFLPSHGAPYMFQSPSMVYAMDTSTGRLVQVVKSVGVITVTAAPIGGKAIIVLPEEHSNGRAWLYDGSAAAGQLPLDFSFINPYFVVWTADAERVMFYGGSTIDADAWNILGVVALRNLTVSKVKLFAPTEQVYVCPGTGHIFTGMPGIDRSGHLEIGRAVEYGADLRLISTANILPAGNFSATCRYVATPSSAHGPIPWRIVDGRNGRELMYFEFTGGESGKEEFEFRSWNPKRDHLLLRTRYRPGGPNGTATDLEVFDISRRVVVESLPGFSGEAAWSADGRSLIVSRGRSIVFHLVPDPSRPLNSR